jgi:hypothetical protein
MVLCVVTEHSEKPLIDLPVHQRVGAHSGQVSVEVRGDYCPGCAAYLEENAQTAAKDLHARSFKK